MNVLVVSPYFKPLWEGGGPPRTAYALAKGLADRGHDVTVYTTNVKSIDYQLPTNRPVDVDGMQVRYFENLRRFLPDPEMLPPLPYALPFVVQNEISSFDVVHIHEHRTVLAAAVATQARRHSVPYVIQPHGSVLAFFQRQRAKRLFDRVIGSSVLKHADRLLALTATEAEQIINMGVDASKVVLLPNGIDPADMELCAPGLFRRHLGIGDEPLLLYLARFNPIKGPDVLIESFPHVLRSLPRARLAMVGPDEGFQEEVKSKARNLGIDDYVLFPGPIYDAEMKRAAYSDSDVYVLPSRHEAFPISVLEAWAVGTPVIVTDRCGLREEVHEAGAVVPLDPHAMADAIIAMLCDQKGAREMGARGRKKVFGSYTWPLVTDRLEQLLEDLSRSRNGQKD